MRRDREPAFLRSLSLRESAPEGAYPFDVPAVGELDELRLSPITVLVGENGSGKSTIVEAIAVAAGFNPEGGGRNLQFTTHSTHSELAEHLALRWATKPNWGWFLRAETFYGMASHIARDSHPEHGVAALFPDLHGRSHGESFLTLVESRFKGPGLYLLDEPESALSFQGQLQLLRVIHERARGGSQFIIATHSPILMGVPEAAIYELSDAGTRRQSYDDLPVVSLWRRFLTAPDLILDILLSDESHDTKNNSGAANELPTERCRR